MDDLSRRSALKLVVLGTTLLSARRASQAFAQANSAKAGAISNLSNTHDRVWLGGSFWANPMEDWRIIDGAAECIKPGGDRNVHLITHQITNAKGSFEMSVRVSRVATGKNDGGAGFRIGIQSDIKEHRASSFAKGGINAGFDGNALVLGQGSNKMDANIKFEDLTLHLSGSPGDKQYALTLTLKNKAGDSIGTITQIAAPAAILGNVAVVSNLMSAQNVGMGGRYRFADWTATGDAFTIKPDQAFGPILWAMYSLSDSRGDEGFVMKLSALTGPLGEKDNKKITLQIKKEGAWKSIADAELDTDAWTAVFRIAKWDEKTATPYRLVYQQSNRDGSTTEFDYTGTIRANPVDRPVRLGALTCQNDYAFPYEPVAKNVVKLDPDMLYFSGDQLYENHGGYGIIRDPAEPAILNYLRKFYQFGWSFRDAMRDRPTLCIPDDHDVFHGNIWGESGAPMKAGTTSSEGGYRQPARMVNVVHRTCAGHHPDPYDGTPVLQDISVYYGDVVFGRVSFAVLGDRQFKSGPQHVDTGGGRADHVQDKNFDTSKLDKPGLVLLGERQEKFLTEWADDWRGCDIKVLLSQTPFAAVATHHGGYNGYLKADLDAGGWPQTARNRAVKILTKAMPLHINGDQHITTLVQYGVEKQRESAWSFCPPAIAVGYPRWWRPDEVGMPHENRPKHNLPHTGEYIDGFGNKVYVYAVGNPEVGKEKNRYDLAHQKGSGFGLVIIDTKKKTYEIHSYRFNIDPTDGKEGNEFPGWPVTIQQKENRGENVIG
ncbi:MAG: alkaline phosphatase D family protein [Phycisphaeraceae bacterium]